MKKKVVSLTFVSIFMLSIMIGAQFSVVLVTSFGETNVLNNHQINSIIASSKTIWVPDNYTNIQWAVGNATAEDTIRVRAEIYYEQVTINKSLTLIGENPSTTIIDGSSGRNVIKCLGVSHVNISGFTIRNGISAGINLTQSTNITISGNIVTNNVGYGIFLELSNNNSIYSNTVLSSGARGIYLRFSNNNFVNNNTVSNHNQWGIYLYRSGNNVVSNNRVSNNRERGIYQIESNDNNFTGNTVSNNAYGISIWYSERNTLRNNKMNGNRYNFDISAVALGQYIQDIDPSNTINGKPMYYWVSQNNTQVPAGAGYVAVINSKNITVRDQTLTNNAQGVLFAYTTNSTITNVNASNNSIGIYIVDEQVWDEEKQCFLPSSGNNIINSSILANNYWSGIEFDFSSDNTFTGNTVINNYYGVSCAFCNNTLYHNNFLDNINLTYRKVSPSLPVINVWDNGYPSGGNYWSDYNGTDLHSGPYQNETDSDGIGDTPYVLDEYNRDNYPLMIPFGDTQAPVADAGLNQSILQGMTVTFNGSGSTDDVGIKSYVWTFRDVTLQTLTGINPTYTFNNTGNFEVTLSVSDYAKRRDTDTMWVNVSADTVPPIANTTYTRRIVYEDWPMRFNGSASWDNVRIIDYTWTFMDVTPQTLKGINPVYIFKTPGVHIVTLNVSDVAGNWDTDNVTITVIDMIPIADAGPDQTVNEDTLVTLDGSNSLYSVDIINYTWTFTDVTLQTLIGVKTTYNFTTPGVYNITLNVTDAEGNWDTDNVTITVLDVTPPVADAGSDQTVEVGTTVTFNASGSSDNVGIVSYEWDFGDGNTTTVTDPIIYHTYTAAGTYNVTLTVKDAAGNSDNDTITVVVEAVSAAFPWWIVGILVASGIVAAMVAYLAKVRKKAKT